MCPVCGGAGCKNWTMSTPHLGTFALVVVGLATSLVGCGGGSDDEPGSIERGLAQIPMAVYDEADRSSPIIEVIDVVAMNEMLDLPAPAAGRDPDDIVDSMIALGGTGQTGVAQVAAGWSMEPSPRRTGAEEFNEVIGLDVGAIELYAGIGSPPLYFSTYLGDVELSSTLEDMGGGVSSLGSGDDFETAMDQVSRLSPIGVPLRLGQREGAVALSYSTPAIESWLDDDAESLAADVDFLEVARAFDRLGAPTALIVEDDFGLDPTGVIGSQASPEQAARMLEELEENAIGEPFGIVGIGGAVIDGEASIIAVYVFGNEDAATDSVDAIEYLWSDTQLLSNRQPVDDLVELDSVTADGSVVTVVARPLDGRSTQIGFDFLLTKDAMFQHR